LNVLMKKKSLLTLTVGPEKISGIFVLSLMEKTTTLLTGSFYKKNKRHSIKSVVYFLLISILMILFYINHVADILYAEDDEIFHLRLRLDNPYITV